MKHNNKKYEHIQDRDSKKTIPADEPVFLIRGQDKLGPMILESYATAHELANGHPAITAGVRAQAYKMREWQAKTGKSKIAD